MTSRNVYLSIRLRSPVLQVMLYELDVLLDRLDCVDHDLGFGHPFVGRRRRRLPRSA
jgi:hypothetical protein